MMSETNQKTFDAFVQKEGSFVFIEIPFSPCEVWGKMPRYAVAGSINGISVRGTLGALEKNYFLRLGAAWLKNSGIELGENVSVCLSLESTQEDKIASDIAKALSKNYDVKKFFDGLTAAKRKNFIRWIESAKREETRIRRINEMIRLLEEAKREE